VLTLVLILGIPVIATLAWYHGAKGLKKISGPELAILTVLLFIAGTLLWVFSGTSEERKTAQVERRATAGPVAAPTVTVTPPATPPAPRTAVAVLPFANLTGDASKEYLGDGMAEELINTLTKVQGLMVPARTSTFAYKGRNVDVRQIAKDLGVGTVLEGSVRAAGKRIRITAQLINAQNGLHLWSENYDEEFTDIFKLQDKLANAIAMALEPQLADVAGNPVPQTQPTQDVGAYNLYLQALALLKSLNPPCSIELATQAIERDPKFARAYALLAWGHAALLSEGIETDTAEAEKFARQALVLGPDTVAEGMVETVLADMSLRSGRWLDAEGRQQKALSLVGADPDVLLRRIVLLGAAGKLGAALELSQRIYDLAPAVAESSADLAWVYGLLGRETEEKKYAELAVTLGYPEFLSAVAGPSIRAALKAGDFDKAANLSTAATFRGPEPATQLAAQKIARSVYVALADARQRPAALAALKGFDPMQQTASAEARAGRCGTGVQWYVQLGAIDEAYALANRCQDLDGKAVGVLFQYGGMWGPEMRPFRRDPRFQSLATRVGLMEYWAKYGAPDNCELRNNKLTCH
jgi:TolB-like protein